MDDLTPKRSGMPLWINRADKKEPGRYEKEYAKMLSETYRHNQVIVFFKKIPGEKEIKEVQEDLIASVKELKGNVPDKVEVIKCDNCICPVVLFIGSDFHTVINTEGVKVGSRPRPPVVGEYSLNFYNRSPFDKSEGDPFAKFKLEPRPSSEDKKKDKIVVAVLDTGFDPKLVDPAYLWKNNDFKSDCYAKAESGWNFSDLSTGGNGGPDFTDDHPGRHGTVVTKYIINEFLNSKMNAVEIMSLKTHDKAGLGDFFGIVCALHFAIAKGANIINASWGFYYYYQNQFPYLNELINKTLRKKGILFVAAAGNQFPGEDAIARQIYQSEYGVNLTDDQLRNLAIHHFYPGDLSALKNNVITATTTDGANTTSPTQNYSKVYADIGVEADKDMKFKVPFDGSREMIGGSSFATAIATGVIGAFSSKRIFTPNNPNKADIFKVLSDPGSTGTSYQVVFDVPPLSRKHIRRGVSTRKTH